MNKRTSIISIGATALLLCSGLSAPASTVDTIPDVTSASDTLLTYFPQSADAIASASGEGDANPSRLVEEVDERGAVAVSAFPDESLAQVEGQASAGRVASAQPDSTARITPIQIGLDESVKPVDEAAGIAAYVNHDKTLAQYTLPGEFGFQIITTTTERPDTDSLAFPITSGDGEPALVDIQADGSAVASDAYGRELGVVAPPWAQDATGRQLATEFRVEDGVLVQWVDYSDPNIKFPVFSDPNWTYALYWTIGPTSVVNVTKIRNEFYECFSCVFAADPLLNGAPSYMPSYGEIVPLTLGGIGNFTVKKGEERFDPAYDEFWWYFLAEPGHVDGYGSNIRFHWRFGTGPDGSWNGTIEQMVTAFIVNDFPLGNGTYQAAASRSWEYMANTLRLFIVGPQPGDPPTP